MHVMGRLHVPVILAAMTSVCLPSGAVYGQYGGWPAVFDPLQLLTLNLDMDPGDWQTIQNDETLDIEVPAWFWTAGEDPILISVRRKSGDPLQNGTPFGLTALHLAHRAHGRRHT